MKHQYIKFEEFEKKVQKKVQIMLNYIKEVLASGLDPSTPHEKQAALPETFLYVPDAQATHGPPYTHRELIHPNRDWSLTRLMIFHTTLLDVLRLFLLGGVLSDI